MAESGVKDIPMRLTGALAYHCAEQARALGITPAEYARSCVRLQLRAKGIDWNRLPEGVDPGDPELPGQQRLEHVADADSYRNPPTSRAATEDEDPFE